MFINILAKNKFGSVAISNGRMNSILWIIRIVVFVDIFHMVVNV